MNAKLHFLGLSKLNFLVPPHQLEGVQVAIGYERIKVMRSFFASKI